MAETLPVSTIRTEPSGQEYELKDAKARQNLSVMKDDIDNFDLELEGIKKSVRDGKTLLADAITRKSVITEPTSSLPVMAENISKIRSGTGYSGPYYSIISPNPGDDYMRLYNGFPYVYTSLYGGDYNNMPVVADYDWQDSNDWHLVSQYYNSASKTDWLDDLFIMGLYNEKTLTGLGISSYTTELYLRCYTVDSPYQYTEYKIVLDNYSQTKLNGLIKVFFDLHYTYDTTTGRGYMTLSYADATQQLLKWVEIFKQYITLAPTSLGVPIYLLGPANLNSVGTGRATRYLHIGESALVLDGYIAWGNSSLYPFRDCEIPYGLSGWKNIGGNWYYYEDGQRVLKTGWQDIKGGRYYFNSLGEEQKSTWIDNKYWVGEDGKMATNQWITNTANANKYYVGADGAIVIGWADIGSDRYFFNTLGVMQKNKWIEKIYWVGADGKMARDEWVDSDKYYVGPDGKWVKNAVKPT